MNPIFLMAVFEVKHFLADFILQGKFHVGKFAKVNWEIPLAHHCLIHATFTMAILYFYHSTAYWLVLVDFWIHFIMDRIKASPDLLGQFKPLNGDAYFKAVLDAESEIDYANPKSILTNQTARQALRDNKLFWWSLGLDQLVHQLTSLFIVMVMCSCQ